MKKAIGSIILLWFFFCGNAQDTICTLQRFQHDSLQTTLVPERIVHVRDSIVTIFDTSYTHDFYYKSKEYSHAEIVGTYTTIVPIYDTIAAHDSTYTCYCADHDSLICVVQIDTTDNHVDYGTFMYADASTFTPIAFRLNILKTKHLGTWWRSSYDLGQANWDVKQVHDSAVKSVMTFNNYHPGLHIDYPKPDSLQHWADELGTRLRQEKPDLMTYENEPANQVYHVNCNVYDYIAILHRGIDSAHKYGIPACDGGLIQSIVYYVRWVYKQEGKTDSVAWLNSHGGLAPTDGPIAQWVIDWHKIFIPWLASSQADYVNIHWYKPFRIPDSSNIHRDDSLFYVVCHFLEARTGKKVISNELGTRNSDQDYFNFSMDEYKAGGLKQMIYFNGNGTSAIKNEDFWSIWIALQLM